MKRITRRMVAGAIGLVVGWHAAGLVSVLGPGVSFASDAQHGASDVPEAANGHGDSGGKHADQGASAGHASSVGGHDEYDAAYAAAQQLVPRPEDVSWYGCVVRVIAGLFVAAVVLGIPALKLRGPELPDPAAAAHGDDHH